MDQAEEIYKRLKSYNINHTKWLEFLKSIENEPRGVYNTSELDDRLFLLDDQNKAVQGQCKAAKDEIAGLIKSLPSETQLEMENERLASLRRQRDEIQSEVKGILTKMQQIQLLRDLKSSLDNQLEIVQKEYETEDSPDAPAAKESEPRYKELLSQLDKFKSSLD